MGRVALPRCDRKRMILEKGRDLHLAISEVVKRLTDGRTQKNIADSVCYSQSTLNLLLNGSSPTKNWPLYLLQAIADDAGVPLSALIQEAERVMKGAEPVLVSRRKRAELSAKLEALRAEVREVEEELKSVTQSFKEFEQK